MNKEQKQTINEMDRSSSQEELPAPEICHDRFGLERTDSDSSFASFREMIRQNCKKLSEIKEALDEDYAEKNAELEAEQRYLEAQAESRKKALLDIENRFRQHSESNSLEELLKELDREIMRPFASLEIGFDSQDEGDKSASSVQN